MLSSSNGACEDSEQAPTRLSAPPSVWTLKLHELVKHSTKQLKEEGTLLNSDTRCGGEDLQPLIKSKFRSTSGHNATRDRETILRYTCSSLFHDLRLEEERDPLPRSSLDRNPLIDEDIIDFAKPKSNDGNIHETICSNLKRLGRRLGLELDSRELRSKFGSKLRNLGSITRFAHSIKFQVKCKDNRAVRYSEESLGVYGLNRQPLHVMSFGAIPRSSTWCKSPSGKCRYHNEDATLFPPYCFHGSAAHGFPILFVESNEGKFTLLLELSEKETTNQTIPTTLAQRYGLRFELRCIPLELVRDRLLVVSCNGSLFVFHAGSKIFERPAE